EWRQGFPPLRALAPSPVGSFPNPSSPLPRRFRSGRATNHPSDRYHGFGSSMAWRSADANASLGIHTVSPPRFVANIQELFSVRRTHPNPGVAHLMVMHLGIVE